MVHRERSTWVTGAVEQWLPQWEALEESWLVVSGLCQPELARTSYCYLWVTTMAGMAW